MSEKLSLNHKIYFVASNKQGDLMWN